jgi:hypothetical protein
MLVAALSGSERPTIVSANGGVAYPGRHGRCRAVPAAPSPSGKTGRGRSSPSGPIEDVDRPEWGLTSRAMAGEESSEQFVTDPPIAAAEAEAVLAELERVRGYIAWKCGGLDAAQMRATLGPSTITLGGLVKHLALVEDAHFARLLYNRKPGPPWDAVDFDADPDWEWRTAADDSPDDLWALWHQALARSRSAVSAALADGGLDHVGAYVSSNGESPNLRRMLLDLNEEYARHLGHADLIRESIDGLVGEDPK